MDLDPQCNLTIFSLDMEKIHKIWAAEDKFIDDFASEREKISEEEFSRILDENRSLHFLLKPAEDGTEELKKLPPAIALSEGVDLLPGRLTLHLFEAKIGERWSGVYQGDPLAIRTATRVRQIAYDYAAKNNYDVVIFDTSPSLGALNRNLLTLADGFIIPCSPDLFSVYGIRNIGSALKLWKKQFDTIFQLISNAKRSQFPDRFVKLIGYTIYNAKPYGNLNPLKLANAHYHYAEQIPTTIRDFVSSENTIDFQKYLTTSMGDNSVIYSHNTFPSMSQKYHLPMWRLPNQKHLERGDASTIGGNQAKYLVTKIQYENFAKDLLARIELL